MALALFRNVLEVRVALRILVNFAVVLGFALDRRRRWGLGIFFLGERRDDWVMSSHKARWSPGESANEE